MNQINTKLTIIFACLICLLNTACTTIKPVYDDPQASIASQLKPGDRVRLTLINDRVKEVNITEIDEAGIKGTIHKNSTIQRKGAIVDEEWADVFSVETVKISPIKTAGAAVGVVAAIPFVALGLVFMGAGGY
jgi:hypothetical protein